MTAFRFLPAALLLAAFAARPALAQQNEPTALRRGSELRITLAGSVLPLHPATGQTITLVGADSMFFWVSGISREKQDTIAYQALYRMEVRGGRYTRGGAVARGALGVAGLEGVGFVIAAFLNRHRLHDPDYWRGVGIFVGSGAVVGAGFGAVASTDRWDDVRPPLRIVAQPDSAGTR